MLSEAEPLRPPPYNAAATAIPLAVVMTLPTFLAFAVKFWAIILVFPTLAFTFLSSTSTAALKVPTPLPVALTVTAALPAFAFITELSSATILTLPALLIVVSLESSASSVPIYASVFTLTSCALAAAAPAK